MGGRFAVDTFGIGADTGQPVATACQPPFEFTGETEMGTVEVRRRAAE